VVLRQPAALAFASADVLRSRLLLIGGLATLLFIALSIWLAGRVARPVQALSAAATRVGLGEAPTFEALAPRRRDEVAELAGTLQVLHLELARRMAEQQRASARFQALFEGAPVAIYLSVDQRLTMANAACLALFGAADLSQLQGRPAQDLLLPSAEATPPAPAVDRRLRRLDGAVLDVEMTVTPIDVDGHPGLQVALRDVTEARRDRQRHQIQQQDARQGVGWRLVHAVRARQAPELVGEQAHQGEAGQHDERIAGLATEAPVEIGEHAVIGLGLAAQQGPDGGEQLQQADRQRGNAQHEGGLRDAGE